MTIPAEIKKSIGGHGDFIETELRRLADKYGEGRLMVAVQRWIEQVEKEEKECQK